MTICDDGAATRGGATDITVSDKDSAGEF